MPACVLRATSHSSLAQASALFHQFPELHHGPEAAITRRCLLQRRTKWGTMPLSSTDVSSAGRNIRKVRGNAGIRSAISQVAVVKGSTVKESGLYVSVIFGAPMQRIALASELPTSPRIRASVISSFSASGDGGANRLPCANRGFIGIAWTETFLMGEEKVCFSRSSRSNVNRTFLS